MKKIILVLWLLPTFAIAQPAPQQRQLTPTELIGVIRTVENQRNLAQTMQANCEGLSAGLQEQIQLAKTIASL